MELVGVGDEVDRDDAAACDGEADDGDEFATGCDNEACGAVDDCGSRERRERSRSVLEAEIGRAALARVEVIGPARRGEFVLRVPVRVRRFGALELDERASLELPPEAAPPQGAILELVATLARPRIAEMAEQAKMNWPNSVFLTIKDATHVTLQTSECSVATALSFLENPVIPDPDTCD